MFGVTICNNFHFFFKNPVFHEGCVSLQITTYAIFVNHELVDKGGISLDLCTKRHLAKEIVLSCNGDFLKGQKVKSKLHSYSKETFFPSYTFGYD